jgi:ribulose kinase
LVASQTCDTKTWRDASDARIFEQSTTDIFEAICRCVQDVLSESRVDKGDVKGVGFDATCSLAVVDTNGNPVCVSKGKGICGEIGDRNIVLWADHRAEDEARTINESGSVVLDYVGGSMSVSFTFLSRSLFSISIARDGDTEDTVAEEAYA